MKFALGKKLRMSQIFDVDGIVQPVTLISVKPMDVTLLRDNEKHGYSAVQVGYGEKSVKNSKQSHIKSSDKEKAYEALKEFSSDDKEFKVGDKIDATELFKKGDIVSVSAISKGKGFQGVVKRHGFAGGNRTHGNKHTERTGGAIGGGLPTRVPKGKKMPGRMGGEKVTQKGKTVVRVDKEEGLLLIKGSVPGRNGALVEIKSI